MGKDYPMKPEMIAIIDEFKRTVEEAQKMTNLSIHDSANKHVFNEIDVPWLARALYIELLKKTEFGEPYPPLAVQAFGAAEVFYAEMKTRMGHPAH